MGTKPNLPNQTYQTNPTKPNLPNQTYQTKPTKPNLPKPNLPNQTYQTKPTKPNLPNQAYQTKHAKPNLCTKQGGITCGAIEDPRKSSKAIDERVIINFRDKNGVIARFLY